MVSKRRVVRRRVRCHSNGRICTVCLGLVLRPHSLIVNAQCLSESPFTCISASVHQRIPRHYANKQSLARVCANHGC